MALRTLARSTTAALALALTASAESAQTDLSQTVLLQNGVAGSMMNAFSFQVLTAGTFTLSTRAPHHDGVLFLFEGTSGSLGGLLASDDDACSFAVCGPSGAYSNAIFTLALDEGFYTAIGSDYGFSEWEARSGVNELRQNGDFGIVVSSPTGVALAVGDVSTVPEPGTIALLGTGMLAVGGFGALRRRRQSQG